MYLILGLNCILAFFREDILNIPDKLIQLKQHGYELIITNTELIELKRGKRDTIKKITTYISDGIFTVQNCINGNILTHYKNRYPQLGLCDISLILKGVEFNQKGDDYLCIIDWKSSVIQANEIALNHITTLSLLLLMRDNSIITNHELMDLSQKL